MERDTKKTRPKKSKKPDLFTSEMIYLEGKEPGSRQAMVALQVLQPTNPNHRPNYKICLCRVENRGKEVYRADGPDGSTKRFIVPEEVLIHTGDMRVDAIDPLDIDVDALAAALKALQRRKIEETEAWEKGKRERKRQRRRRYQNRKRMREQQSAPEGTAQEQSPEQPMEMHLRA